MEILASIDIGSHTARLLISGQTAPPACLRTILRKRAYIRLAQGFDEQGSRMIRPDAVDRTLEALEEFVVFTAGEGVREVYAVATGVVRKAVNAESFLNRILEHTGIRVDVLSGEEEARLTGKGVLHSLGPRSGPFLIFDLGGGSTEFIYQDRTGGPEVRSLELGAMLLKERFLKNDPPKDEEIRSLAGYVDMRLESALKGWDVSGEGVLAGTGGTVATLAAMSCGIDAEEISPERLNGTILDKTGVEGLFEKMRTMDTEERAVLRGLDRGRADVIVSGTLIVSGIMRHFGKECMTVSISDILEGVLLDRIERQCSSWSIKEN